jgi:hypothetical protein
MIINMNDAKLGTIEEVKSFIKLSQNVSFKGSSRQEKYDWISEVWQRFKYRILKKKDKSIVKTYLLRMTGFSDAQITRLIKKKNDRGLIKVESSKEKTFFPTVYTNDDILLIGETDLHHSCLSGPATKAIFKREFIFGNEAFVRLKDISVSHLYNLRKSFKYLKKVGKNLTKTTPIRINIGKRKKPEPNGKPGYIRVDTVHQGDLGKVKGVYHINLVDEVTQWEIVGSVESISENFLIPILEAAIQQFPFIIIEFHSDNGSEYINYMVAKLLNKLLIDQTKSRARHTNDNALVESKNGSVIRKHMGCIHIPQKFASVINQFYNHHFNSYLNYHRPCGFATTITDKKGKQKKVYKTYLTPYEKLKTIPNFETYLKETITPKDLEEIAKKKSDNECAKDMQEAKLSLFKSFRK